jgi:hypothetical protein
MCLKGTEELTIVTQIPPSPPAHGQRPAEQHRLHLSHEPARPQYNHPVPRAPADQPMQSIEPTSPWQQQVFEQVPNQRRSHGAGYQARPMTPDRQRNGYPQRVFVDLSAPTPPRENGAVYPFPPVRDYRGDVIDLITPPRPRVEVPGSAPSYRVAPEGNSRYDYVPQYCQVQSNAFDGRPQQHGISQHAAQIPGRRSPHQVFMAPPLGLLPLQEEQQVQQARPAPGMYATPAQPVYQTIYEEHMVPAHTPQQYDHRFPANPAITHSQHAEPMYPRPVYLDEAARTRPPPLPVHGAPAPVQQMPRAPMFRPSYHAISTPQYEAVAAANIQQESRNRAFSVGQRPAG